jgi:alpha-acetolactate decarboxylase
VPIPPDTTRASPVPLVDDLGRTAGDVAGVGPPGLHLHGVTRDRSAGGHVLSCIAGSDVQLSVQRADGVHLAAPSS